jgi:hypothetical protein
LNLRPEAEALSAICFDLVATRTLASGESLTCCYQSFCLPGPVCDRCCTAEEEFIAAVATGFELTVDSTKCFPFPHTVFARGLTSCDRIQWWISNLTGGSGIGGTGQGNAAFQFSIADTGRYEIEMQVRRTDLSGTACYDTVWRSYRDTIDVSCTIVGVREISEPLFRLWPNPATAELHLDLATSGNYRIDCFDSRGQFYRLHPLVTTGLQRQFSLADLPAGIYILRIRSPDGQVYTRTFCKLN